MNNSAIVFGDKPPIVENMKTLARALTNVDKHFQINLHKGWVPNTKKYKKIHGWVSKMVTPKINVSFQQSDQSEHIFQSGSVQECPFDDAPQIVTSSF